MRYRAKANELAASVGGDAELAWIDGQRNEVFVARMVRHWLPVAGLTASDRLVALDLQARRHTHARGAIVGGP